MSDTPSSENYVAGRLSEEENARFEAEMIKRPELAADVDVRQRIKLGMSLLDERQELEPLLKSRPTAGLRPKVAIAASLLVAVVAGGVLWRPLPGQPVLFAADLERVSRTTSRIDLASLRSESELAVVSAPKDGAMVGLKVLVAAPPGVAYAAQLQSASSKDIWQKAEGVITAGDGNIYMLLDTRKLPAGELRLVLTPPEGLPETFLFELRHIP